MLKKSQVLVKIADKRWKEAVPGVLALCREAAVAAWENEPGAEVSVLLTDDKTVADLNGRYRGKPVPTNVLSFPAEEDGWAGDVAVAYETVVREAAEEKVPVVRHLLKMLVHGVMHLRGYDHMTAPDAELMEGKEAVINRLLCERFKL